MSPFDAKASPGSLWNGLSVEECPLLTLKLIIRRLIYMAWCPKCRSEYREGFDSCSECGEALVDELPDEQAESPTIKKAFDDDDIPVFLVSAADNFEADILEGKLEAYGVPVMKQHKDAGGYLHIYMGASPFGIDLYVPSKLLEKAKEILQSVPEVAEDSSENLQEEIEEQQELQEESEKRKDRSRNWLFLLFVVPVLIYLLISLLTYGR
jgi:hypothetical protein